MTGCTTTHGPYLYCGPGCYVKMPKVPRYLTAYVENAGPGLHGNRITDWHGKVVHGYVLTATRVRLARWSHVHGSHIWHYRVRLVTGEECYGRGGPGMVIRLKYVDNNGGK